MGDTVIVVSCICRALKSTCPTIHEGPHAEQVRGTKGLEIGAETSAPPSLEYWEFSPLSLHRDRHASCSDVYFVSVMCARSLGDRP